ncbi:Protein of unknown function [Gryllus bimaculatus]|nr:Protein of unknown function [Gryllus bimaculatus]
MGEYQKTKQLNILSYFYYLVHAKIALKVNNVAQRFLNTGANGEFCSSQNTDKIMYFPVSCFPMACVLALCNSIICLKGKEIEPGGNLLSHLQGRASSSVCRKFSRLPSSLSFSPAQLSMPSTLFTYIYILFAFLRNNLLCKMRREKKQELKLIFYFDTAIQIKLLSVT